MKSVDNQKGKMSLVLDPGQLTSRPPPRQEVKQQARKPKQGPPKEGVTKVASASASTGKAKKKGASGKSKNVAGGLSALGSALAGAGLKGRAQLDREASQAEKRSAAGWSLFRACSSCCLKDFDACQNPNQVLPACPHSML